MGKVRVRNSRAGKKTRMSELMHEVDGEEEVKPEMLRCCCSPGTSSSFFRGGWRSRSRSRSRGGEEEEGHTGDESLKPRVQKHHALVPPYCTTTTTTTTRDRLVEMVRRRKPTHLVPKAKRHVLGVCIQRRARRGREGFGDGGKDGGVGDVRVWNGVREEDGEPPGEGGGGDEETGGEFEGGSEEGVVVGGKGGEVRGAEHRVDGVEKGAWGRVVGGGG